MKKRLTNSRELQDDPDSRINKALETLELLDTSCQITEYKTQEKTHAIRQPNDP
jgi:hypothetical protein